MRNLRTFSDVHAELKQFIPSINSQHKAYTTERIQRLMAALGNPQDSYKVIHVAGTSGKTSTCYYLASLLKTAGYKTGMTVSPHVDEINERVQINLEPLPEEQFCRQFDRFLELITATGIRPTYFELLIAFAYWQFAEAGVDYAVVEVGLGGLLDGTNVISRSDKVCVITDIGLDHTEVLGKTIGEIAAQKAGIIRPHNSVFVHQQDETVMQVVREISRQQQAELYEIRQPAVKNSSMRLPLFQQRNWNLALSVYRYLAVRDGLPELQKQQLVAGSQVYIPARMEIIRLKNRKTLIIDGAHNAQKIQALASSIMVDYPGQSIAVLLALVQSKGSRTRGAVAAVTAMASWIILTSFKGEQDTPKVSVNPAKLAEICHIRGYDDWQVITDPRAAFQILLDRPERTLLVTGSFYLLNHIRPLARSVQLKG